MTRRKRRTRLKTVFNQVWESFQDDVRLIPQSPESANEDAEEANTSDLQRSPESMLYESQEVDLLQYKELSPEIVPVFSKIKLDFENDACQSNETVTGETKKSNAPQRDTRRLEYPLNNPVRNIKYVDDLLELTNDCPSDEQNLVSSNNELSRTNKTTNVVYNEKSSRDTFSTKLVLSTSTYKSPYGNASSLQATTFHSSLESLSHDGIFTDEIPTLSRREFRSPDEKHIERFLKGDLTQRVDTSGTADDCHLLDQTLLMNDDLVCEMNTYVEGQSSSVTSADNRSTEKATSPISNRRSQTKYLSESTSFAPRKNVVQFKSANEIQLLEEFVSIESVREPINGHDESRDNSDQKGKSHEYNDAKNFAVTEKANERLTVNWKELGKILMYLRQINVKLHAENVEHSVSLLSKYKKTIDSERFPYVLVSTSPSSASRATSTSPISSETPFATRNITYTLLTNDNQKLERPRGEDKVKSRIQQCTITPYSGSSPSATRCRMTLKFENDDGEETENQGQSTARVKITDSLPKEGKSENRSCRPCPRSYDKTQWDSCTSESTPASNVGLPAVSDQDGYDGNFLQEMECQGGSCKCHVSRDTATLRDSQDLPRGRNIFYAIVTRVTSFCIWLIKKLLHLLISGYRKLRRINISFSSVGLTQTPRTKEFGRLITMLRLENEKIICALSEKVTRLSTNFLQTQTSIEATLNALTAEVNGVREASEKITEHNKMLIEEMKKLHETLVDVRLKSLESVSLPPSCPTLLHPPAPSQTPSPPPPPCPSILPPPPPISPSKVHALEAVSLVTPPPPPPFPSALLHSPMPLPTLNGNKGNRYKTPTTKCSTPLSNRPSITVEDLLKVTLKKAPQNVKDKRWSTVPGPRGPVVSLDMLRNVKLKSARRRTNDQTGISPRSGRIVKNRATSSLSLSPITTGPDGNMERLLRQVDLNRRRPRRLISSPTSFRARDFAKDA